MFDKLDDILLRLEEIHKSLSDTAVQADPALFQKLMKEEAELSPVAAVYTDYKKAKQTIEDDLEMLGSEKDEEMREMLKDELAFAKEHSMTSREFIDELKGLERFVFSKLDAGGFSKKLYRLFEYRKS